MNRLPLKLRQQVLQRNRAILRENLEVLHGWIADHHGLLKLIPPDAGGMAFMRYDLDINSTELTRRLRQEKSVLIVPGDCFGMDRFLRVGFGSERSYLAAGLERTADFLAGLRG